MALDAPEIVWLVIMLEVAAFVLAFIANHLFASKNRIGWLVYISFSIAIVWLFWLKDSPVTVINQSFVIFLAVKNYRVWGKENITENHSSHKLDYIGIVIFLISLFFFRVSDVAAYFEVLMWACIIGKNFYLGRQKKGGWVVFIFQKIVAIFFNFHKSTFILMSRHLIGLVQGIYGLWKWKIESVKISERRRQVSDLE